MYGWVPTAAGNTHEEQEGVRDQGTTGSHCCFSNTFHLVGNRLSARASPVRRLPHLARLIVWAAALVLLVRHPAPRAREQRREQHAHPPMHEATRTDSQSDSDDGWVGIAARVAAREPGDVLALQRPPTVLRTRSRPSCAPK
ncbi:hypothetical protein C8R46DRAFT_1219890 [Mycena filopes]|nr:hypothetical protein C8R46DRAFT_1239799 [Mycena filopes]KAJ7166135.1 hypothetical protein C8R46DRAFT_1219890 [Mycena filopes]